MGSSGGGGGGTTQTVEKSDPWAGQQPFLTTGFEEAEDKFLNFTPTFFSGSTVVPFSPETELALQQTTQRALDGSPVRNAATTELSNTLSGNYLYGGDGFNAAVDAAVRRAQPGIDSQFALSGRYGSGLAQEAVGRAVGDIFADQYNQERTNQMRAMMFAPQISELDYSDISKLAAVGQQREALEQEQLAEQIARHDFDQSVEQRQLQEYMNLVQGNYGGNTVTTSNSSVGGGNSGAGFLGGALSGASTAYQLGGLLGSSTMMGPWGILGGGLAGGLLGLF